MTYLKLRFKAFLFALRCAWSVLRFGKSERFGPVHMEGPGVDAWDKIRDRK